MGGAMSRPKIHCSVVVRNHVSGMAYRPSPRETYWSAPALAPCEGCHCRCAPKAAEHRRPTVVGVVLPRNPLPPR